MGTLRWHAADTETTTPSGGHGSSQAPPSGLRSGVGPGSGPGLSPGSGPSTRSHKAGRQGRPAGEPHGAGCRRPLLPGRCGYVFRAATAKDTTPGLESGPRDQLLGTEQAHGWPLSQRWASRVVPRWWSVRGVGVGCSDSSWVRTILVISDRRLMSVALFLAGELWGWSSL